MSKIVVTKVTNTDNGGGSFTLVLQIKVKSNSYTSTSSDVYVSPTMTKDDIVTTLVNKNSAFFGEAPTNSRVWEYIRPYSSPQTENEVITGFVNTLSGSLFLLPTV